MIHPALDSNLRVMAHDCRELLGIMEALDNDPGAMARIWGYTQQDTDNRIDQLIDEIKRLCYPTLFAMMQKWQEERKAGG